MLSTYADDIHELARDRELVSAELHQPSDFYGHASCIKRFVGMDVNASLHAVVVHGPMMPSLHWHVDLDAPLPVLLTSSHGACQGLRERTGKLVFSIGPVLAYASPHLSEVALAGEKGTLGRNLLVFPSHSTHHVAAMYDAKAMCAQIEQVAKDYDSVTVCLYWKDIQTGVDEVFRSAGFHCRTAGHIYDHYFLDRLKTLLTLSDAVMCYSWTSAIGYAVSMNKPVMALHAPAERFVADEEIIKRDTLNCAVDVATVEYRKRIFELFADMRETTEKQREAIDYMWGLSQVRSKDALLEIVQVAQDMFVTAHELGLSSFPAVLAMARIYVSMGLVAKALRVLEQAVIMGREDAEVLLLLARLRLAKGDVSLALIYVKKVMKQYPHLRAHCSGIVQEAAEAAAKTSLL